MAKIPSRRVLPSGAVPTAQIPQDIADTGQGLEARALGDIGQGIGRLGAVLGQIQLKNQETDDILSSDRAGQDRTKAEGEFALFKENNPNPELWDAEINRLADETDTAFGQREFNDARRKEREGIFQGGWTRQFKISNQVQAIGLKNKIAVTSTTDTWTDDFVAGRDTIQSEQNLLDALKNEFGENEDGTLSALGVVKRDAIMESAELQKAEHLENVGISQFHAALEAASNPQTGTGDFTVATELAKNPDIPEKTQTSMRSSIKTAENAFVAGKKVNNEKAIEAELDKVDQIFILPQDEFLASVQTALADINSSDVLPVKGVNGAGKEGQRKKINDRVNAIRAGKVDPITQFDPDHYEKLSRRIANNSSEVSTTEIGTSVGRGEVGGLTGAQSEDLIRLKKLYDNADILGTDTHKIYMGALVGMRTAKAFSKNKAENSRLAARAQVALNRWAVKNPEATESDYQSFMDNLVDNSNLTGWERLRIHGNLNEDRFAIQENLDEIEAELGIAKPVKVISKDGVEGTVPADELEQALKEGFKRVE